MSGAAFTNFAGVRLSTGTITIPFYGLWAADVAFPDAGDIPATGLLAFGDLSLFGTVVRTLPYAGSRTARIVGGYNGWSKTLPARAYALPSGIPLSMLLGDAAKECGELVKLATDGSVGARYIRDVSPAGFLLRAFAPLWWVDPTGVTRVGPRDNDGTAITSAFDVIDASGGLGRFVVATDAPSEWMPGRTFAGPTVPEAKTVSLVTHTVKGGGVGRVEVLAA